MALNSGPEGVFTESYGFQPKTLREHFQGAGSSFGDRYELTYLYDGGLFAAVKRMGKDTLYLAELRPPFVDVDGETASRTARIGHTELDLDGQVEAAQVRDQLDQV